MDVFAHYYAPCTGDAPDVGVKELLAQQEQQLRTRNTMLIVPGKSFKGVCCCHSYTSSNRHLITRRVTGF